MTYQVKVFLDYYVFDETNRNFIVGIYDPSLKTKKATAFMFLANIENNPYNLVAFGISKCFETNRKKAIIYDREKHKAIIDREYSVMIDASRINNAHFDVKELLKFFEGQAEGINTIENCADVIAEKIKVVL